MLSVQTHLSLKCAPVCAPELSCSPAGMQRCGGQDEGDAQNLADPEVTLTCSQASSFMDIAHLRTLHCSWGNIPGQRKELNSHKRARGGNLSLTEKDLLVLATSQHLSRQHHAV